MTFIGLFLLAVSMNEYIDPRSRLSRWDRAVSAVRSAGLGERSAVGQGLRAYYRDAPLRHRARGACGRRCQLSAVERNEIYGLAGESSCGKTTLIKTIAGGDTPAAAGAWAAR